MEADTFAGTGGKSDEIQLYLPIFAE